MNRILSGLALVTTLGLVVGCGGADKPPPYANVSGTVSFNGKPLEKGTITFATDGRPPSVLDIVDGQYSGQALVGSNKVSISSRRKSGGGKALPPQAEAQIKAYAQSGGPPGATSGGGGTVSEYDVSGTEIIPPEWSTASKQMRVIEAGTANKLDFDIKAK